MNHELLFGNALGAGTEDKCYKNTAINISNMMLSKKHRNTITEKNNLTTAGVHIAYKYLLHIRIKCCLHMHIKIALTIINSLLLFRLMTFKNHFTGKKTEKKSTLEAFKLFLCFIILGSANSFAFLNLDIFGLFFSPISFHA